MTPEQEKALDSAMGKAGYERREETERDSVAQPPVPRTAAGKPRNAYTTCPTCGMPFEAAEQSVLQPQAAIPPLDDLTIGEMQRILAKAMGCPLDDQFPDCSHGGDAWEYARHLIRDGYTFARLADGAQATPQPAERSEPARPTEGPCIFEGCVSRERHGHGGFPGGYDNPADPEGPPIEFTAEPAPGVRDYNGAILPAAQPSASGLGHRHGSAWPAPRSKGEITKHLTESHGFEIPNPHYWTLATLIADHRASHRDAQTEGLEQAS